MNKLTFIAALLKAAATVPLQRLRRGPHRPHWSLGYEVYVRMLQDASPRAWKHDYPTQRRVAASLSSPNRAMRQVRTTAARHGEFFEPPRITQAGVYMYFHGGGFNGGYTQTHRNFAAEQALAIGARVFAANYRLAPDYVFPAQYDDACAAYAWLLEQTQEPIIVGGDSAGANLALLLHLHEKTRGCIALSPWLDLSETPHGADDWVRPQDWQAWADVYLAGADPKNPLVSPAYADINNDNVGPILIQVGTAEGLYPQAKRFAEKVGMLSAHADMVHGWQLFGLQESESALNEIAAFYSSCVTR